MGAFRGAAEVLSKAESELANLVALATKERNYEEAAYLIELTSTLRSLVLRVQEQTATPGAEAGDNDSSRPRPSRIRAGDYPRFFQDGVSLVKLGWSRTERAEYEHKSP